MRIWLNAIHAEQCHLLAILARDDPTPCMLADVKLAALHQRLQLHQVLLGMRQQRSHARRKIFVLDEPRERAKVLRRASEPDPKFG